MVNVRLLGEFALDIDGRHVPASAFPRRNAAALVKLLALAPSRRLHREQVMDPLCMLFDEPRPGVRARPG